MTWVKVICKQFTPRNGLRSCWVKRARRMEGTPHPEASTLVVGQIESPTVQRIWYHGAYVVRVLVAVCERENIMEIPLKLSLEKQDEEGGE